MIALWVKPRFLSFRVLYGWLRLPAAGCCPAGQHQGRCELGGHGAVRRLPASAADPAPPGLDRRPLTAWPGSWPFRVYRYLECVVVGERDCACERTRPSWHVRLGFNTDCDGYFLPSGPHARAQTKRKEQKTQPRTTAATTTTTTRTLCRSCRLILLATRIGRTRCGS